MTELLFSKVRSLSVTFPEDQFQLSEVEAEEYKRNVSEEGFSKDVYRKKIKPYPHLFFENNIAEVASSKSEVTSKMPWTIDMVRQLRAFKDGGIKCQTAEQKDIARKATGKELFDSPEDFTDNFNVYKKAYEALCKPFKAETREECEEYIKRIQDKIIKPFSIVNVAIPEFKNNVPKFVKAIDLKRQTLAILIEELFEK